MVYYNIRLAYQRYQEHFIDFPKQNSKA